MKQRKWKVLRRGTVLLAALALTLGGTVRAEEGPDELPTVIWLEGDYDVATYLGEGVVLAGKSYSMGVKGGMRGSVDTVINLNSEEIGLPLSKWVELPSGEEAWLYGGESFFHGYMAVHGTTTGSENEVIYHWGLMDPEGNFPIPLEYATEEEAWAQVGLTTPVMPYDRLERVINDDNLYGYADEDGTLLVDYRFDDAMPFTGAAYARVNKDGRVGLLKDPRRKDTVSPWAEPEVAAALSAGLVPSRCQGYYTYEITRSQMAALLVRYAEQALGEELPLPADHPFTDTQDTYIEKAYAAGIVQGMGDGRFAPDRVVTREQLAAMLYRAIRLVTPGWGESGPSPAGYTDFDQVSSWAREAVAALLAQKVMNGVSATRISPKSFCTTEQAILLVSRLAAGA